MAELLPEAERKWLKDEYPWLVDEEDIPTPGTDFSLWIDYMAPGWWNAFGYDLLKELKQAIEQDGMTDTYHIDQVKEKCGGLRWYDNGGKHVHAVIDKYCELSEQLCVECGEPAEWIAKGWITPYCDNCKERLARYGNQFIKKMREL